MKKFKTKIIILNLLFLLTLPSIAATLKGGVSYTVDDVRQMALENVPKYGDTISYGDKKYKLYLNTDLDNVSIIADFSEFHLKFISHKEIGVKYKDVPNKEFFYIKIFNEYIINSINTKETLENGITRIVKRHPDNGKIWSIFIMLSDTGDMSGSESYIFNAKGKLIGHWKGYNGNMYKNKVKMTRSIRYKEQD